ncbi:MAG: hypothetical protein ACRC8K_08015, partial [Waterburya sp.]
HNLGIETAEGSLFSSQHINSQAVGEWAGPVEGHIYLITIDPNFGGSDNWVTQVWDVTEYPRSLVAEYAESDRSTDYSLQKTLGLIDLYDAALIAIESNSGGKVIAENIAKARPGIRIEVTVTTNTSKRINTDRIALGLEQCEFIYAENWAGKAEFRKFSAKDRCATGGAKDDRVMAMAAGWPYVDELIVLDISGDATDDIDMSYLDNL